jgi:hypothetical protein
MQSRIAFGLLVGYLIHYMYQILWFLKSKETKSNHETQMSITCMSTLLQIDGFQRCLKFDFFPLKNGFRVAMFSIEFNKHWVKIG